MARRRSRRIDLTLLLAVAPFFAAGCAGPEERHCVEADGTYVDDWQCDEADGRYRTGTHWVYVPHRRYAGVGGHAGSYVHATSPSGGGRSGGATSVSRGGFGATGAGHAGAGE